MKRACRKVTMEMLARSKKIRWDFKSTTIETPKKPEVFPSRTPHLLSTDHRDIAVGNGIQYAAAQHR
jgi:DNA gyrase/topoisomerase IV subunit A